MSYFGIFGIVFFPLSCIVASLPPLTAATFHGGVHDAQTGDGGVPEEVQCQEKTQGVWACVCVCVCVSGCEHHIKCKMLHAATKATY